MVIYTRSLPALILALADTPAMRRLQKVGMYCGCEYTALPVYRKAAASRSRLEHSLGTAGIVWHFTHDIRQSTAALLHDIAVPCFAHTVDFLRGDALRQEATEAGTEKVIAASVEIGELLGRAGIAAKDVSNYHRYPIADNPLPALSADRLEYLLGDAEHLLGYTGGQAIYDDIITVQNALGTEEMCFAHLEAAREFGFIALRTAQLYASPEDRCAMQTLADLLRDALDIGAMAEEDLKGTEPALIARLTACPDTALRWRQFCALRGVRVLTQPTDSEPCLRVAVKRRAVDPLVQAGGQAVRLSDADAEYCRAYREFLDAPQDSWIAGVR